MKIETYKLGPLGTNTYLLQEGNDVILIDPASKAEKLIDILGDRNLIGILLTHGHFDHIKAVDGLYDKYKCPVYLHEADEYIARDKYAGADFGLSAYITCPTIHLNEGILNIGSFNIEVVYTPGHTPGSVIFIVKDNIFTGDTLFKGSVGRTDLDGGNASLLRESLRFFKSLNRDFYIYPGHDLSSKLSYELDTNYFLR